MHSSLRGHFLIASRRLLDPNFFKTVVLMVEHNETGAMGLIVNRPSGVTVSRALEKHFELPDDGEMVYIGGPVEQDSLFILHNVGHLDTTEPEVVTGLYVGSSAEVFEEVMRRASEGEPKLRFRIFSGCAGWGPGQLEGELGRNDWLVLRATEALVFAEDPYQSWDIAVRDARAANSITPGARGEPDLN